MSRLSERVAFTALILTGVAVICVLTLRLPPVARTVPLAVVIPTLGLLIVQLAFDCVPALEGLYRKLGMVDLFGVEQERKRAWGRIGEPRRRQELSMIGWVMLLPALVWLVGFIIAVPVYATFHLRLGSGETWRFSVLSGACVSGLLYGVFVLLLHVRLYPGIFWAWLGS